jgi:SPP1 gp7 family putative phage head morphogenesis protein
MLGTQTCPDCGHKPVFSNVDFTKIFEKLYDKFKEALKYVYKIGDFNENMLLEEPIANLTDETASVFKKALKDPSIKQEIPEELLKVLEKDIFIFSQCKTYIELKNCMLFLTDLNGDVKPFYKFLKDVRSIHKNYNELYLKAEYNFAVSSAQMSAKWVNYSDSEKVLLQYRTVGDERVRETHKALDLITLPKSNSFWDRYYPPNGWLCRCTVVEVRASKYEESDPIDAKKKGEDATTKMNKKGENTLEIFRFNPAKKGVLFPPKHPYRAVQNLMP